MTPSALTAPPVKAGLKQPSGWFAAGEPFRQALGLLSDGAFKLFAYLCLQADRHTGRLEATHQELAAALGKSRRIIGNYASELEAKQVCHVTPGKNQFERTGFQISDDYWPYHRLQLVVSEAESSPLPDYVEFIRQQFLAIGCGSGQFGTSSQRLARQLEAHGIALEIVEDALLLGACRKYLSWLNGAASEPIGSLSYFEPLMTELQQRPLSDSYRNHLRQQLRRLAQKWENSASSAKTGFRGGSVNGGACPPLVAQKGNKQNAGKADEDDIDYQLIT